MAIGGAKSSPRLRQYLDQQSSELRNNALKALTDAVNFVKGKHNPSDDLAARTSQDLEYRNSTLNEGPEQSVFASRSIEDGSQRVRLRDGFIAILGEINDGFGVMPRSRLSRARRRNRIDRTRPNSPIDQLFEIQEKFQRSGTFRFVSVYKIGVMASFDLQRLLQINVPAPNSIGVDLENDRHCQTPFRRGY